MWIVWKRNDANRKLDWKYNVEDNELEEALAVSD